MADDINKIKKENTDIDYSSDTQDYYNQLKNESYSAMLDSQIQASIAKEQALKYTNNALQQAGYANQGLAQSTQAGIQNQYQNALQQAGQTYRQDLSNINNQMRSEALANKETELAKLETEQANKASQLETLLSSAQNKEQLNNTLKAYLGDADENNNYDYSSLGNNANYIKALQDIYRQGYTSETTNGYSTLTDLQSSNYITSNNKVTNLGTQFKEETSLAFAKAELGELDTGAVVKLDNTKKKSGGDVAYIMWTGSGFKLVREKDYKDAKVKHEAIWNSGGSTTWN